MSRDTSTTFRNAVMAQETGEVPLLLLTLDHADLSVPIRVVNNSKDIVSGGETFIAFPMEITLADDPEERMPQASISIDNVDRSIVTAVRTITSAPTITIELILASDPDTIEASYDNFTMKSISYDSLTVTGTLTIEDFTLEPFPGGSMLPGNFAGLF